MKVDQLYVKWIETSWKNREAITIIEHAGKVAGYFNFKMDQTLSTALGCSYGRLRSLALDGAVRGQGLGRKLFLGTIATIKEMGGRYVDSGYASKNHRSAHLHVISRFNSVYEEVTLHLWL
jgi:N-acetylglutamate synthase-like GNAT family acetyltransferase